MGLWQMNLKDIADIAAPTIAAIAIAVGIWQYRSISQREFTKPVREAQLKLYEDASREAARLATLQRSSPEWLKSYYDFVALYYGPMAMVEEFDHGPRRDDNLLTVEDAMILFKSCLEDENECKVLGSNLVDLSLALAHTCRVSLGRSWGVTVEQLAGDYQQRAVDYRKKLLAHRKTETLPRSPPQ
jgi:hypothetical protein